MTPEDKKRYRDRANRGRRALLTEKEQHGYISDGAGKRYNVPIYYVLAGANDKALDFYSWYESEFPDDVGEPIFNLYWALAEFRADHIKEAEYKLKITMISNMYMLPFLFHEPIEQLDIWHSSTVEHLSYLYEAEAFLKEPTEAERLWIKQSYDSQQFLDLRNGYIAAYSALQHEHDFHKRGDILNKWRKLSAKLLEE